MSDFMSFMAVSFPHKEKKHNKDELVVKILGFDVVRKFLARTIWEL